MLLAILGLIFIQIYWVKNAIQVQEQQFNRLVNDALVRIVNELEEQETVFYVYDQLSKGKGGTDSSLQLGISEEYYVNEAGFIVHRFNRLNQKGEQKIIWVDSILIQGNNDEGNVKQVFENLELKKKKSREL